MPRPTAGRSLRLFAALRPPAEAVARLFDLQAPLLERIGVGSARFTPREQVHLTLQFIGDTPAARLDDVKESVSRAASGLRAFELSAVSLATIPMQDRPRLLAAICDAPPTLSELHDRLAHRLARSKKDRAREDFVPHLTLSRFELQPPEKALVHTIEPVRFLVDHITLYASVLHPEGAEHRAILRVDLDPPRR
jgi:RNA 2',3'-cyclic 3'-phosphodiesterase